MRKVPPINLKKELLEAYDLLKYCPKPALPIYKSYLTHFEELLDNGFYKGQKLQPANYKPLPYPRDTLRQVVADMHVHIPNLDKTEYQKIWSAFKEYGSGNGHYMRSWWKLFGEVYTARADKNPNIDTKVYAQFADQICELLAGMVILHAFRFICEDDTITHRALEWGHDDNVHQISAYAFMNYPNKDENPTRVEKASLQIIQKAFA